MTSRIMEDPEPITRFESDRNFIWDFLVILQVNCAMKKALDIMKYRFTYFAFISRSNKYVKIIQNEHDIRQLYHPVVAMCRYHF